ncbi:glycosyl hydrolase [Microdochium trichocladiopsis]|uniref:Glycosyl hydrolase n=1 Tax=Microdochium trichocladiopsis TaxID=1682393 RepID=A0A9P8YD73_9PEZI|nr:glycosyl hydrolase [Microdochium trichocladiopsis]KAH7034796.1 glycosyl hydrolase [Microdochium trichocladiopsis]
MQAVLGFSASAATHLSPAGALPALPFDSASLPLSTPYSQGAVNMPDYTTSEAGNPFISGWYADPDTGFYENEYWVFPTASFRYEEQTYLDAFSSPDLVHWTKHPRILTTDDIPWAHKAVWAPSPVYRNGKYYLYFGANDIQVDEIAEGKVGGIGVAVADHPGGPYKDALGKPLIGDFHNGAQPIDQDVFIDRPGSSGRGDESNDGGEEEEEDNAQAYMYYGGHGHANIVKLNRDMISLGSFDAEGNDVFREITPANYTEGSQMFVRKGVYYYMWSEGGWTGPDYSVSYAMSRESPLGPFTLPAGNNNSSSGGNKILQQDPSVARGSGHNGVIHVPGTDIWYIVYHRRPLSETDGNHRVVCYDRMFFDDDNGGAILPVQMLVKDNFADGGMIAWKTFDIGGGHGEGAVGAAQGHQDQGKSRWEVIEHRLVGSNTGGPKTATLAMLDTNFGDFIFDATIGFPEVISPEDGGSSGHAQLIFWARGNAREGYSEYNYVGLRPTTTEAGARLAVNIGSVVNGTATVLTSTTTDLRATGKELAVRVTAQEGVVLVRVKASAAGGVGTEAGPDSAGEATVLKASTHVSRSGANGVAVQGTASGVKFGHISVAHPPPKTRG